MNLTVNTGEKNKLYKPSKMHSHSSEHLCTCSGASHPAHLKMYSAHIHYSVKNSRNDNSNDLRLEQLTTSFGRAFHSTIVLQKKEYLNTSFLY